VHRLGRGRRRRYGLHFGSGRRSLARSRLHARLRVRGKLRPSRFGRAYDQRHFDRSDALLQGSVGETKRADDHGCVQGHCARRSREPRKVHRRDYRKAGSMRTRQRRGGGLLGTHWRSRSRSRRSSNSNSQLQTAAAPPRRLHGIRAARAARRKRPVSLRCAARSGVQTLAPMKRPRFAARQACPVRRVERDWPTVGACAACATPPIDMFQASKLGTPDRLAGENACSRKRVKPQERAEFAHCFERTR